MRKPKFNFFGVPTTLNIASILCCFAAGMCFLYWVPAIHNSVLFWLLWGASWQYFWPVLEVNLGE